MKIFYKFLISSIFFWILVSCSGTSYERTKDASAVSALSSDVYTDKGVNSSTTVLFSYDRFSLSSNSRSEISSLAMIIKENNLNVRIEGHCDERGTREYNLALGERRANSVSEILIINGVSKSKIKTVSYGEEKPINNRSNEKAWSENRRAVIKTF